MSDTAPLWAQARTFLCWICSLFGEPQDIAQRIVLTRDAHKLICAWLRAGEAVLRRLLLIEAGALPKFNLPPPAQRPKRPRKQRFAEFWPDKPRDWRVSFHALEPALAPRAPSAPAPQSDTSEPRAEPRRFFDVWPVAIRLEALLRAFDNPAPYAQRLARRLRRAPKRIYALLRALRHPPDRLGEDLLNAISEALPGAAVSFVDSS